METAEAEEIVGDHRYDEAHISLISFMTLVVDW
jgi:hypothetical protein